MQEIPINTIESANVVLDIIFQMKVKSVMNTHLVTVHQNHTMQEAKEVMRKHGVTGVPVTDDNDKRLLGIVSVDDIINALEKGYMQEKVSKHMTRQVIVLEEDMPLSFAITYFDRYKFRRFPILDKHKELVGVISSRDISGHLLAEMNRKLEHIEQLHAPEPATDTQAQGVKYLRFQVVQHDFENAGHASTEIKKALKTMGVNAKIMRRVAIATYELEINIVVHSLGGEIIAQLKDGAVHITAQDRGPGIESIDNALTEGFSTANEWIRSLGFGAGMGLPNAKRVSDDFSISSSPLGTTVTVIIQLDPKENS